MTKIKRRTEILMHQLADMRAHWDVDQRPQMRTILARIHKAARDRGRREWATQLILGQLKIW